MKKRRSPLRLAKISFKTLPCSYYKFLYIIIIGLLFWKPTSLLGQQKDQARSGVWNLYSLPAPAVNTSYARMQNTDTLTVPFWDDFSYADTGSPANNSYSPSPRLWAEGSNTVRVNTGLDIAPPTVGIATFDGVGADGQP